MNVSIYIHKRMYLFIYGIVPVWNETNLYALRHEVLKSMLQLQHVYGGFTLPQLFYYSMHACLMWG